MTQVLLAIVGFVIAIGILVSIHEFGHFWVARRFGIKVKRFSIGFGHPFFRWYDKLGTEYVLSTIPLGGYVSLFGERHEDIPPSERHMAFSYKPVWVRMLVLVAGPVFNLLLAIIAFWFMFLIGITSIAPILGNIPIGSPADLAGLKKGQEIVSVDGQKVTTWEGVTVAILDKIGEAHTIQLDVRPDEKGPLETHVLHVAGQEGRDEDFLKELGLVEFDPMPAVVTGVLSGYPAESAGLQIGDHIVSVNGKPISTRSEVTEFIQSKEGESLTLGVKRGEALKDIKIVPIAKKEEGGKVIGFIGIEYGYEKIPNKEYLRVQRFGPWESFVQAVKRTWEYSVLTLKMLKKMIVGTVSLKHLSGPISIAQYAGKSVSIGLEYFLNFLAVISISLGILNLLPIPLLDGGHLMYCIWETITGRRVSDAAEAVGVWIGAAFLIIVTIIAFYNDISRF